MKQRAGFVSNSSSSSFMVAGPKDELSKGIITIAVKLNQLVDKVIDSETGLARFFDREYGKDWREDGEYTVGLYDAALGAIRAGKAVAIGHVSSEGDGIEIALYDEPELFTAAIKASGFELIEELVV